MYANLFPAYLLNSLSPLFLQTQFQFSVEASADSQTASTISPAIWDLVRSHKFETLELTLTRGHWPFSPSSSSSPLWAAVPPPGLELKMSFLKNKTTSAKESINLNKDLQALGHSLSSLVAASVPALVDHGVWTAPAVGWWQRWSSRAQSGNRGNTNAVHRRQLYGALTQEGPCVENLSAWLRMLPCKGGKGGGGLAGLLQAEAFVASPLHSLHLTLDTYGSGIRTTSNRGIALTLGFTMLRKGNNVEALTRALGNYFPCPVASRSSILLPSSILEKEVSFERNRCVPVQTAFLHGTTEMMQLCTLASSPPQSSGDSIEAIAPVGPQTPKSSLWSLDVSSSMIPTSSQITTLSVSAFITSPLTDSEYNTLERRNTDTTTSSSTVLVHIMQMVPWEVSLRWHTLKFSFNGIPLLLRDSDNSKNNTPIKEGEAAAAVVVWKNFQPAQSRGNAALIELLLKLPLANKINPVGEEEEGGRSSEQEVHFQVEIKKKLLTVFDFPPDASRGIDVPAALITLVPPSQESIQNSEALDSNSTLSLIAAALGCCPPSQQKGRTQAVLSRRSAPQLINLPIPDASMPFNVVCFTSTIIALTFGSALNAILTKAPLNKVKQENTDAEEEKSKRRRAIKLKLARVVAVLVIVGITAVYMDKDLQRQVDAWLDKLAALWPSAPGSHHPEL